MFIPLLDRELTKVAIFYEHQEKELIHELEHLEKSILEQEELGLGRYYDDFTDDDDDDSLDGSMSPVMRRQSESRQRRVSISGHQRRSTSAYLPRVAPWPAISSIYFVDRSAPVSQSPVRRRTSISSIEDIQPQLENSYHGSLPPLKPTGGTLSKISTTFNNLRESLSSVHDQDNTVWTARSGDAYDIRLLFKRRITNLYISFTNLRSYIEVNYAGFRKIVKKYVFNISFYAFDCPLRYRHLDECFHPWTTRSLASYSLLTTASTWITCQTTSLLG